MLYQAEPRGAALARDTKTLAVTPATSLSSKMVTYGGCYGTGRTSTARMLRIITDTRRPA
jgi:hypothetical protein